MSQTLNSWNEIAAHLSRGVRTVQRWHLKLHLPIYKAGNNPRTPVFAYKAELDTWMRTHTERDGTATRNVPKVLQSEPELVPQGSQHPRKSILYVDDHESVLRLRRLVLESRGFAVTTASSGDKAVAMFKANGYAAVVVDYQMPKMNGAALAAEFKRMAPRTPIIMLTAHPEAAEEVTDVVDAFVHKADDANALLSKLEPLVRLRGHSHRQLQRKYVVFANSSRQYLDCSDAVCELLGYSRMELLDMCIDDLSYDPAEVPVLFKKYLRRGMLKGKFILKHRTGRPILITYESHVFSDGCMAAVWQPVQILLPE
jgi:CheY-like chemotaxis protein